MTFPKIRPMQVRLYRCNACHMVQAFEVKGGEIEYTETCPCGERLGWTRIKVVD